MSARKRRHHCSSCGCQKQFLQNSVLLRSRLPRHIFGFDLGRARVRSSTETNGYSAHPVADNEHPFRGRVFGRSPDLRVKALCWPSRDIPVALSAALAAYSCGGSCRFGAKSTALHSLLLPGESPGTEHGVFMPEHAKRGQQSFPSLSRPFAKLEYPHPLDQYRIDPDSFITAVLQPSYLASCHAWCSRYRRCCTLIDGDPRMASSRPEKQYDRSP